MKTIDRSKWKLLLVAAPIALLLAFAIPSVASAEDGVQVVLFNDSNENGEIDAGEMLDSPHKIQISGSGDYSTGDTIPAGDLPASGRLHSGGVYGDWRNMDPADDDGGDSEKLELEFATVHVTLYNGDETLDHPHRVEVSGVGDLTTCDPFHVPPDTEISYRLHSGGVYGGWQKTKFSVGKTEW